THPSTTLLPTLSLHDALPISCNRRRSELHEPKCRARSQKPTSMTRGEFKIFRCGIVGVEAVESDTRHVFPRHTHEQFGIGVIHRSEEHTSELQSRGHLVCRLL